MFHSAGYFRGVVCPFYEHGLCHRPHCHYRHSKPATKSVVKKLPKLRSRLVAPPQTEPSPVATATTSTDIKPASSDAVSEKAPLQQPQDGPPKPGQPVSSTDQTSSESTKKEEGIAGGAEASEKFVSEVSAVIGKIASFYGSGLDSGSTSGDANNVGTAGPPSSDVMITSPPEISSEQVAVTITTATSIATPPAPPTATSLPSYAPENCVATVTDSDYQPIREPSTDVHVAAQTDDEIPTFSDATPLVVDAPPDPSAPDDSVDVATLESILVTEKEIFGDSGKMSDSDDDIHDDDGGVAMETGVLNAEELAWIEAEFKKITAVPPLPSTTTATAGETSSANQTTTQDKKPQKSERKLVDVSLKKKRVAHSNTKVVREPVKLHTATHSVSSNFGGSIDKSAVYMGKKRLAKPSEDAPAAKRPKLALTPNAKIPTKVRQRFLDSFIDEFLKTNPQPEEAYEKALSEEKVLFERASNRMIYMNVSTLALKRIRNQTAARLAQLKEVAMKEHREDEEKEKNSGHLLGGAGEGGEEGESKTVKMKGRGGEGKALVEKTLAAAGVEKKNLKGWRLLEAELQSSFGGDSGSTAAVDSGQISSPSGAAISPSPQHSAVFSSSQFYSKKSQKSSTTSVEGAEVGKVKSRKAHSKKKMPSKSKSDLFSQKLSEIDRLQTKVSISNTASSERDNMKRTKMDHQSTPNTVVTTPKDSSAKIAKPDPLQLAVPSSAAAPKDQKLPEIDQRQTPPSSKEVADSKKGKKSKLKKDKHLPKKARHSKDGASSVESSQHDSLSEPKEMVTKSRPTSLASTPSVNTCTSGSTKRLSETKDLSNQASPADVVSDPTGSSSVQTVLSHTKKLSVTIDSLKNFRRSINAHAMPPSSSTHEIGSEKKSRPYSKEEATAASPPKMMNTSAEPAQDILTTLCEAQSSSWVEPMETADLATELFGGSDSDSEREEGERAAVVSDIIKRMISEGEIGEPSATDSDEVSNSQGISFDSALCGEGVAKTKRRVSVSKKMKGAKKPKKKLKVRGSSSSDGLQTGDSDGKKGGHPTQLDLSVFNLKSPTVRLAKTPTGQGQSRGFPLSPTSSSGQATPTDHMTSSGPTTPTDVVSPTETYSNERSSRHSSDSAGNSADTAFPKETSDVKKTIISPQYLPSGPLINLTKVAAAQHKKNQMSYTSLVAKHAAMANKMKATPKAPPTTQKKKATPIAAPPTRQPAKPTYSIIRRREIELTAPLFYSHMQTYVLSENQLLENGYPRPTAKAGEASIHRNTNASSSSQQSNEIRPVGPNAMEHRCCRCSKRFIIYNSGQYQRPEECVHHYGRLFKNKEYGEGVVSKYTCCQGRRDSAGCQVAKFHVTAGERPTLDKGYVITEAPPIDSAYHPSVYALDCEMCYTTVGLQLTRVSVINMSLQPIYEKLVKPSHPIVDYNTRFSGLTSDDMVGVETSLQDVQSDLLKLFFTDTILLGHSLESDLTSLKVIHSCVVDTAIVFPHKKGPPYKRALKTLMAEYMQKFIQDSIDGGHDSLEDSRACMELMLWKIKQDLKKASRTSNTSDK